MPAPAMITSTFVILTELFRHYSRCERIASETRTVNGETRVRLKTDLNLAVLNLLSGHRNLNQIAVATRLAHPAVAKLGEPRKNSAVICGIVGKDLFGNDLTVDDDLEICGEFDKKRTYAEKKNLFSQDKVVSVLLYANENYKQKCLLYDASASVGFDYAYISKLFKKSIGITYNQYVNYLRIQESKKLLKTTGKTITEIALESGFLSLRVFNRKFSEIEGTTPSVYRNQ